MEKSFAIRSKKFSNYQRIKKDLEKIGYEWNNSLNHFEKVKMISCDCVWVSNAWNKANDLKFSFSNAGDNTIIFNIDTANGYEKCIKYAKECAIKEEKTLSVDKVTIERLDLCLRMCGYRVEKEFIDKIIDLVELIEEKGDLVSIKDICKLEVAWEKIYPKC